LAQPSNERRFRLFLEPPSPCPRCNCPRVTRVGLVDDVGFFRCADCGGVFTIPRTARAGVGNPTGLSGRLYNIEQPTRHARAYARLLPRKGKAPTWHSNATTPPNVSPASTSSWLRTSPPLPRNRSLVSKHHSWSSRCPKAPRSLLVGRPGGSLAPFPRFPERLFRRIAERRSRDRLRRAKRLPT